MCFSFHGKMSKNKFERKFAANICSVYAEMMLLLLLGICMESPKIQNTRRLNHYLIINYEQILFEYTITRKDESIFLDLWENEFRMLLSTFDLIVNLVESEMRNRNKHSETSCLWLMEIIKRKYVQGCRKFGSFLLWKSFENILQHV